MGRRRSSRVNALFGWVRRQSMKVKGFLAVVSVLCSLIALKHLVRDHTHFFVAAEAIHAAGIMVLIYKLSTLKTCSGLSLKSQELTAIFLAVRLFCSITMEASIHTVLDFATLIPTVWVIYMIRFKLKSTYIKELDNLPIYYMVVPSAILAFLIHPSTHHSQISRMFWAFCVYLESVSVLPQLRLMQNAKMVEPFTAHYVFALGIARFLGCVHWILQVYEKWEVPILHWVWLLVGANGSPFGNGSNFYFGRLLLLLYQKCHGWPTTDKAAFTCLELPVPNSLNFVLDFIFWLMVA